MKFLKEYGVYVPGVVYRVPKEFAVDLIKQGLAVESNDFKAPLVDAQKKMQDSQVAKRGGL